MAYSSKADLELAAGGTQRLLELSDLKDEGVIDDSVVTAAIAAADDWINSYAQRRHAVPFSPTVPGIIARLSALEAIYRLQERRHMVTEAAQAQHEERERWLQDLAKGLVSPGTEPSPAKSTAVVPETFERSPVDGITRSSLKGFC